MQTCITVGDILHLYTNLYISCYCGRIVKESESNLCLLWTNNVTSVKISSSVLYRCFTRTSGISFLTLNTELNIGAIFGLGRESEVPEIYI